MSSHRELGSYIDRTYKVVRQDLINRFKECGITITPEQWVILSKISSKPLYQTDLAHLSYRDKPTVSRIVDLLVENGLVTKTRDHSDGRKYLIGLSEKGNDMVLRARPAVEASRKKGWDNLSSEEYENLVSTLNKIFENYS